MASVIPISWLIVIESKSLVSSITKSNFESKDQNMFLITRVSFKLSPFLFNRLTITNTLENWLEIDSFLNSNPKIFFFFKRVENKDYAKIISNYFEFESKDWNIFLINWVSFKLSPFLFNRFTITNTCENWLEIDFFFFFFSFKWAVNKDYAKIISDYFEESGLPLMSVFLSLE